MGDGVFSEVMPEICPDEVEFYCDNPAGNTVGLFTTVHSKIYPVCKLRGFGVGARRFCMGAGDFLKPKIPRILYPHNNPGWKMYLNILYFTTYIQGMFCQVLL